MPAKTNAQRQAEFRARKASEQQATEVRGIFAHPDDHVEVKEAAAKIARRRQRAAKRASPNAKLTGIARERTHDDQ